MADNTLHYDDMSNENVVIKIKREEYETPGIILSSHWHDQIQFFYCARGNAVIRCNSKEFEVSDNDFVIINSKELHYIESISEGLTLYLIKIDLTFIYSNKADSIQAQFLTPLSQNLILFENVVRNDESLLRCVNRMIHEYFTKEIGFELAIKSQVYDLIVILLRGYIKKIYNESELKSKMLLLQRFKDVIDYIENNFTEKIDLEKLSKIAGFSKGHFCRLFKQITSMSAIDYINNLRINKAFDLLKNSDLNITEIAVSCGFSDSNYFSRIFKNHKKISPMQTKKQSM
ncbi:MULTISPECIES: AraC family transcriptional regulator [Clostridium]|uniref:AraC family transcriptional regulator n=1 Tax=Clostridium TaxID=1485 RepID=UPI0009C63759|nr:MULTISPECIES: AraC family transcriptional regulator [Clostridium]NOW88483.1 AraC-like DNA-binding protein/mannose-6-phosphate isomerase-like protein (cupin superfamily) [Clostridium beijerinckii]NRT78216.1 AraC-like DNA-binding protein/mannose-6-phosphate isomerase-like protein (cupin superfamily) [Clostridium beijerinckii]OOM47928.1 HTH-type transcriptional activator Btr [Clostridium beijerinckii]